MSDIDDGPSDAREAAARIERGDDPREVMRDLFSAKMQRMMEENPLTEAEQCFADRLERQYQQRVWLARFWVIGVN